MFVFFTEEENKVIERVKPKVDTFIGETTQQWMLGSKPIDHEAFLKELKKVGIDELIEVNEKAYERYLSEMKK